MDQSKKVIVVLGAGRSGTSLIMQVLTGMGMSVSEDLVPARYHNPVSPMEDSEIAGIYDKDILPSVGSSRLLPFPHESFTRSTTRGAYLAKLESVLNKHTNINPKNIWGFKDPFTSSVLPLWFKVFNQCGVVPKFILCVRSPSAVVVSREKSFGHDEAIGELVWLNSNVSALYDSRCDVFIVHYEDWFSDPVSLGNDLLNYTGLNEIFNEDLEKLLSNTVKTNLNRTGADDHIIKNKYIKKLYSVLRDCRGCDFDRESLMAEVKECREAMEQFKGWYMLAQQNGRALAVASDKLAYANQQLILKDEMTKRISEMEMELNQKNQIMETIRKLQEQIDHYDEIMSS